MQGVASLNPPPPWLQVRFGPLARARLDRVVTVVDVSAMKIVKALLSLARSVHTSSSSSWQLRKGQRASFGSQACECACQVVAAPYIAI